ncbi:MAG: arylsulfatase [Acidobacteria bacterium]|nr:arylsulfatase [Acidobacteriota bacterium]
MANRRNRRHTRREFLQRAGLAPVVLSAAARLPAAPRPNIIFIMADDLGFGDLGCYGQKLIRTPRIDRMAKEGTRFTQCYSGSPVCAPSRNVLMTGMHTGHTRIRGNSPEVGGTVETFGEGARRLSLEDSDVTVAEFLKRAGYATGVTGKWGLAEPDTAGVPNRRGFDEWFGYLNQNHAPYYYTDYLWKDERRFPLEGNRDGKREQYTHDLFTGFSLDFIRRHHAHPFFLYIAYTIPHERLEVPDLGEYAGRPWPERARIYAAMVTRMDRDVGQMLDLLKGLGIDKRTLVFFTSDNGAPKKDFGDLFKSNGPLRGWKGELWEGGIRVPMIARWPGTVPAGRVCHVPWYFADFVPTAAGLAGVEIPACDGIDVSPVLTGKRRAPSDRFLYWEYPGKTFQQAVRFGKWKAHRTGLNGPLTLYDLEVDPSETTDVSAAHPSVLARIGEYLEDARTESPNWPTRKT